MDLCDIGYVQKLLTRHGFRFSKSMGQNFLIDAAVPREIVARSGLDRSFCALEIGPGIGALTRPLAESAGKVVSVELDRSLFPLLQETVGDLPNVELVSGDILKLDLPALAAERFGGLRPAVCANLPYNITSPVLVKLLESRLFERITVMVQREAALRFCAEAGTPDYGAFTVFLQYYADPELLFPVPAGAFLPRPRVDSAVVLLKTRPAPPAAVDDPDFFFQTVRAAFGQRRKTLVNALHAAFGSGLSKDVLLEMVTACGFPSDIRGERLSLSDFALLARRLRPGAKNCGGQ